MSETVERLVQDLKGHSDVAGIHLAAMEKSGIRVVVVLDKRRDYFRYDRTLNGIWIEQYFNTFERLREAIKKKEEAHTYIFQCGGVLYDPEKRVTELMRLAKRTVLRRNGIPCTNGNEMWRKAFRSLVEYRVVPNTGIGGHVMAILKKEWGKSPGYLRDAKWAAQWVDLNELKLDVGVLASDLFLKEIRERTEFQQERIMNNEPIEPVVAVKNRWLWLIDGYARLYALTRLGLKQSMAYVGQVKGFLGP
ncbi:MAG: hypothetical protein ACETWE_04850 [Candidatus Bathyarchaeia archaeon]